MGGRSEKEKGCSGLKTYEDLFHIGVQFYEEIPLVKCQTNRVVYYIKLKD